MADGEVVRKKRAVIRSADGMWFFDERPHSKPKVYMTGFDSENDVVVSNFKEIWRVGSTGNTFDYAFADESLADKYDVTTEYGTLTVVEPVEHVTDELVSDPGMFCGCPLWWLCWARLGEFDAVNGTDSAFLVARTWSLTSDVKTSIYVEDGKPNPSVSRKYERNDRYLSMYDVAGGESPSRFIGPHPSLGDPSYALPPVLISSASSPFAVTVDGTRAGWCQFIGVYNNYPVYSIDGAGYVFKSILRGHLVFVPEADNGLRKGCIREPMAYRTVTVYKYGEGDDEERSVTGYHGEGWYELDSGKWSGLGYEHVFRPMGAYLGMENPPDPKVIVVSLAVWYSDGGGDGCMSMKGDLKPSGHPLDFTAGDWSWVLETESAGRVRSSSRFILPAAAAACGHTVFNVVHTSTGGRILCPDGLWVFAEDDCGAWVVNLATFNRGKFKHCVQKGKPLYAEYMRKFTRPSGAGSEERTYDDELCDSVEPPDDIMLKWVGDSADHATDGLSLTYQNT